MPVTLTSPIAPSQGYYDYVSSLSPTVYYRFDDTLPTVTDDEGNENGTYVNSPTLGVTGAVSDSSQAVNFNGSTQYINMGTPTSLNNFWERSAGIGTGGTLLFWVRPETVPGSHGTLVSRTNHIGQGWGVYLRDESGGDCRLRLFKAGAGGGGGWNSTGLPVTLNSWNFIVVSLDYITAGTTDAEMYVNGSPVAVTQTETGGGSDTDSTHTMYLCRFNNGTGYLDGDIDEVTFFPNKNWTAGEVAMAWSLV